MSDQKDNKKKASPWKSVQLGLAILAGLIVYAYGFQITKVDLEDLRSERRQESLARVMRALAKPEILAYDQTEEIINSPVYVTCPASGNPTVPEPDTSGPYLVITPTCADPGETVQVEGFNFDGQYGSGQGLYRRGDWRRRTADVHARRITGVSRFEGGAIV